MTTFDAGVLKGNGTEPDRKLEFRETVHGPVIGYARVNGRRVAISSERSTRGRELLSALAFQDLNTNRVHDVASFYRSMNRLEFTFNWVYADDENIALFSSGRLPIRAPGVASGLPTDGSGDDEWRGFEPLAAHIHGTAPTGGVIINWNNKSGRGISASDDNWSFGPDQRVLLLQQDVAKRQVHTLASLVGAMNTAATQDLRGVYAMPAIASAAGTPPDAFDAQLLKLLVAWSPRGAHRLDLTGDGKIDDPGAAIMDAAWPHIADAMMRPTLGPLTDRLKTLESVDDHPNPQGDAFFAGWHSYVVKSLTGGFPGVGRFCGDSAEACRAALWSALDAAGQHLAKAQGPDPAQWRADATAERITFGFLPKTARWVNRPTFQQAIWFDSHRRR